MEVNGEFRVQAALFLRKDLVVIFANHDIETSNEFLETVAN